jgi:serine/threonine-protein kinase
LARVGTANGPQGPTDTDEVDKTIADAREVLLRSGTQVSSRYRLGRLLGAGGMAQVWEATDEVLGRQVAVKVLHPHLADDEQYVRRFRQEAIAAARLSHPGIVGVYDTCSDGDHEAIVMELLDARTLRQVLDERGYLDVESVQRIGFRLLDALEAAHSSGLVHRDIKPSNILLCTDGRVKVADFGIAKADDHTELTTAGSLLGTAHYLAPEQLTEKPVDGRTDLYALGIVLYECLTGRTPFEGDNGAAVALARLHTDPLDPRLLRSDVPPALAEAILRVLRREPSERFPDAAAFRAALRWAADDSAAVQISQAPLVEAGSSSTSFGRSERRWLVPALTIVLVATALFVAGLLLRRTTDSDTSPSLTTTTAVAGDAAITGVSTFDPNGSGAPGENDDLVGAVTDGDPETAWRTESYDSPDFFGSKEGVGLMLALGSSAELRTVTIDGSTNGWSGEIRLFDAGEPRTVGSQDTVAITDVRDQVTVDLAGSRADTVLLWITDLGEGDGRHRVEISEITVDGDTSP